MTRIFNFSAGPATLPEQVIEQIADELLEYKQSGVSIMEMGHRRPEYLEVVTHAERDLRDLLAVPDNYKVLFLPGGARVQFAMLPMNLFGKSAKADYVLTGFWGETAYHEAQKYGDIAIAASSKQDDYLTIPSRESWQIRDDAAYLHYTDNETLTGIEFHDIPSSVPVPLVTDMTSSLLTKPMDISQFGVVYAGAQKNAGIAGLGIVIIREDLLEQALPIVPSVYDYKFEAEQQSLYSTPPTFAWYVSGLVFAWLKANGGIEGFYQRNCQRSQALYDIIDASDFYLNTIPKSVRSRANVTFQFKQENLEALFLSEAEREGMGFLKGHRVVGGIRASSYIGMDDKGMQLLADFMQDFANKHG